MRVAPCKYDDFRNMGSEGLELRWSGCIFWAPEDCRRSGGLLGLDETMFRTPLYFNIGLSLLRRKDFKDWNSLPQAYLKALIEKGLHSRLNGLWDITDSTFLPSLYKVYSHEIERRADKRFDAAW